MKKNLCSVLLCLFAATSPLVAGASFKTSQGDTAATEARGGFPFEFDAEFSYIGRGEVARGFREADIDEDYFAARFVYTPRIKFGILRLGAAYERFGFGFHSDGPRWEVPTGLQSLSAVVGLDTQFSDSILVRFEAQPGFYSSSQLEGDTFHAPFIFGGTYILSDSLQFVLGVSVDYERETPVFPGAGIRWRFASNMVLNAVMPSPRIEWEATKDITFYAGADLKGSTFRMYEGFGDERGNSALNRAVVTYTKIRVGVGMEWALSSQIKLSLEGGFLPYREIDFHRTNVRYHHEEGAPYASVSLRGAF
jgi:hypothetical protein